MKNPFKHLRLLPAVILVGLGLLVVKGAGLALDARAQDTSATTTQAQPPDSTTAASNDPAAEDSEAESSAQVDVLGSLAKRRAELDAREQDLTMRENLIAAAEKRVDDKITGLKDLQSQIQVLLGQRDQAEQKQIDALVKTYSLMKPKDAARLFNTLDETVLMEVAPAMKPDVLGAILAQMQSDQAKSLTVKLANHLKPPKVETAAPQQLAAVQPPADPAQTAPQDTQPQTSMTAPVTPPPPPAITPPPAKTDAKATVKADSKIAAKTPDAKVDAKVDTKTPVKTDVKADTKTDTKKPEEKKAEVQSDSKAPGG
ncbi:MAG: hypothetical protein HY243_04610 [Proteobacteria bacterium]|nr:hypothetical protein [Pseudomonadota bacterium]